LRSLLKNDLRFTESIPFKEGHYPYISGRSLSVISGRSLSVYFRKITIHIFQEGHFPYISGRSLSVISGRSLSVCFKKVTIRIFQEGLQEVSNSRRG
uniref:Ovule protein n=1 Tax=Parascaris univalens TaxID=6257 RepID=A0A915C2Z8_PARUN